MIEGHRRRGQDDLVQRYQELTRKYQEAVEGGRRRQVLARWLMRHARDGVDDYLVKPLELKALLERLGPDGAADGAEPAARLTEETR